jgi:hypothetical protein
MVPLFLENSFLSYVLHQKIRKKSPKKSDHMVTHFYSSKIIILPHIRNQQTASHTHAFFQTILHCVCIGNNTKQKIFSIFRFFYCLVCMCFCVSWNASKEEKNEKLRWIRKKNGSWKDDLSSLAKSKFVFGGDY